MVPIKQMLTEVPRPALVLGLAGLIPFAACAVAVWTSSPVLQVEGVSLLLTYAAVILTFLGGVHWGKALAGEHSGDLNWMRLGWSVTPSLIAWAALRMSPGFTLIIFIAAFAAAFLVDRHAVRTGFFPAWYLPLRKVLTLGVMACLIATLARFTIGAEI
ncbi:DUF3429 domain-containing protein [Hwanghaeella grinnelliae]|uniref:DUF3429 domain-containing protein n=1 Tax=Hwanghaeella grinnelliae TaxID=2500179 RepID=A0A3S2VPI5_9PROT|nr:DUF3429 domain-containing protein [Hwanghaeella grinnelliae]RVU36382.1 DUF3429 domain-containing protein [Hwanghaeella grinnelliae]